MSIICVSGSPIAQHHERGNSKKGDELNGCDMDSLVSALATLAGSDVSPPPPPLCVTRSPIAQHHEGGGSKKDDELKG